jgi:poly(A) polymerase/tRNA nucleotidyltransferase (CCA-adding enzyme)
MMETLKRVDFLPDLYLVGGAVRDLLMGLEPKDLDFTTSAPPEVVMAQAQAHGIQAIPSGLAFGTVTLVFGGRSFEVTTFRRDVTTDGRRAEVAWGQSIEEDLARRDFTINAMAMAAGGGVIDPFGGRQDLTARIIRAVRNPLERFQEDYLRVIRAGRFAARFGFAIEDETLRAAHQVANEILGRVSVERVVQEIEKAFGGPAPSAFLRYLYDLGVLQRLIPEFEGTHRLLQNPTHHPEGDVLTHVLEVVDRTPPAHRWAALLHDIGKRNTAQSVPGERYCTFHGHDQVGADLVPRIARELNLPNAVRDEAATVARLHMRVLNPPASQAAVRRFQVAAGDYLGALEAVCTADGAGRREVEAWFAPQAVPAQPVLLGRHLVARGHQPGPELGRMLKAAFEHQLEVGETDLEKLYQVGTGPAT